MSTTFDSQHCYLQGRKYSVTEFQQLDPSSHGEPTDVKGNELTFCNGPRSTPYFRHKHYEPMTPWHQDWQSKFSESTERTFAITDHSGQQHNRRADVDLNEQQVVEFQHSRISQGEVCGRKDDYKAMNKEIIWVIDGNDGVVVYELREKRVFVEFHTHWKYKAFLDYEYVYLNIGDFVYRLTPKKVRSHMLDVEAPITRADFVEKLKAGTPPFGSPLEVRQSRLFVKQQGAGNGKTFGIVQLIQNIAFAHYEVFVYLTKQHSAVHVIRKEIYDQQKKGLLSDIEFGEPIQYGKKTVLAFRRLADAAGTDDGWRTIVVGTFDSFVYSLARHDITGIDKFQEMVNSLISDEVLSCSESGTVKYAGSLRLNKRLLLIGDEMQDLTENYAKAVIRIMRDWYVDFYAVGDRLQSIAIEKNAFTYFAEVEEASSDRLLPNIVVRREEPLNICRRFIHPTLVKFVNAVVQFDKFGLPRIQAYRAQTPEEATLNPKPLTIFSGKTVYANSNNKDFINAEVDRIMDHYEYEVNTYNRRPEDFLFVFPFVRKNPLMEAVHQRIRDFWLRRTADDTSDDNGRYCHFSFFHKSEHGTSIDLSESDKCTRNVSIHSSKGDGRPVVFVIGITESALRIYSNDTGNLVYDSLWHVALTRMKEKLYIRLEPNGDDIHRRIQSYEDLSGEEFDIEPTFQVKSSLRLSGDLLRIEQDAIFRQCKDLIIRHSEQHGFDIEQHTRDANGGLDTESRIIDMKHHVFRYATMVVHSFLTVIRQQQNVSQIDDKTSLKRQQYVMLRTIADTEVTYCDNRKQYWVLLTDKDSDCLPIHNYSKQGGEYKQHFRSIRDSIDRTQRYLKRLLSHSPPSPEADTPLNHLDYVVLFHLIEVSQNRQYAELPISDLYDLFDIEHNRTTDDKRLYEAEHYRALQQIDALWKRFFAENGPMNILYGHPLTLQSAPTTQLTVRKETTFLAYNSTTAICVLLKPQFTALNYNDTLFHSLFTTHVLQNLRNDHPDEQSHNYQKFGHATTHRHCVMTLSFPAPYYIDWKDSTTGDNLIAKHSAELSAMLHDMMHTHYRRQTTTIYRWYAFIRRQTADKYKQTSDAMDHVIQAYEKKQQKRPHLDAPFVSETLIAIKTRVFDKPAKKRRAHLRSYDDETTFCELLNMKIKGAVDGFFGMGSEEEEEEEEDDESE